MRVPVDAQLPPALARRLEAEGHGAARGGDLGMGAASDGLLWAHAQATAAAVVTRDEDVALRRVTAAGGPRSGAAKR